MKNLTRKFWTKHHNGEVRLNSEGTVDEVVLSNTGMVHLEQMNDDHWWMGIYGDDGRRLSVHIHREGKRILVSVEDDGDHPCKLSEGFK